MEQLIPMSKLRVGQTGCVESIGLSGVIRRRLLDLGLIRGTVVECRMRGPAGNPTAYFFRDTLIALRRTDAEKISVRTC